MRGRKLDRQGAGGLLGRALAEEGVAAVAVGEWRGCREERGGVEVGDGAGGRGTMVVVLVKSEWRDGGLLLDL